MTLQLRRAPGWVRFQHLISISIFLFHVALIGFVNGHGSPTSEVLLPATWLRQVEPRGSTCSEHKIWGICNVIRGGDLDSIEKEVSSTVELDNSKPEIDFSASPYAFTLLQEKDGSETDPDSIPRRYLRMQNDKRDLAIKAVEATLKWRKENEIDTILARPHSKFDVCKKVFPHYFCGRDDGNHVILLQRPGLIDLSIATDNGLAGDDLLYHYIYTMEYLWRILEPAPDATMTSAIDLTGLSFSILRKPELLKFIQKFCSTMDHHFPTRAHKTLLINAPKWFGVIYKLLTPLLRESTKAKISILSGGKEQEEALANLSTGYNVDSDEAWESLVATGMEDEFRDFCLARLEESNESMKELIC